MSTFDYPINAYLRESGGSGDMTVDGSETPVTFFYENADRVLSVHRMLGLIQDVGAFAAAGYGALSALSNGIGFDYVKETGERIDLLAGRPIVTNAGWGAMCYDVQYLEFGNGSSDNYILVRWTFTNSGTEIVLDDGDRLEMIINDDLSGLVHHRWQIQGHVRRVLP